MACTCGSASSTWLITASVAVAVMAATGVSVRVETNSPIAPSAVMHSPTYPPTSGRNSGMTTVTAANATNTPLLVISLKNGGPPPASPDDILIATPMRTGTAISTSSAIWLRRRRKIMPSSDRSSLVLTRRRGCAVGSTRTTAPDSTCTSATDIEALPGQRHEHVLQVRAVHREPAHRHPGQHQRGAQLLGHRAAERGGHPVPVPVHIGQSEVDTRLDREVGLGGLHPDPRLGPGLQLLQRALRHQLAAVHDADVE